MIKIHIDFISDFICPWCYVGKMRLSRIKEKLKGEIELEIEHQPYVLYPQIPKGGLPKSKFAKKTKPGMGKALRYEAEKEGISFNYKYIERIPYSKEAHRLIWLTDDLKKKYELAIKIFRGYFEEGKNIEEHDYLISLAQSVKVKPKTINIFHSTNNGLSEMGIYLQDIKEAFVQIVPTIKIDHKLNLPGLQEEEVWIRYIRKAATLKDK